MSSVTSNTPAYPSGHACQSMLVALYVSSKFPEHEKGVKEAAKECGLGRVKGGFHYLADYVAGNILAEKMFLVMNRDDYGKQINEVKQDKDIKDREGTQPAKYYAKDTEGDTMSKSTKQARATHFKKKKEVEMKMTLLNEQLNKKKDKIQSVNKVEDDLDAKIRIK